MATRIETAANPASSTAPGLSPYRFTVRQFLDMVETRVFPEGEHVELIAGIPSKMVKHEPHNYTVGALGDGLRALLAAGYFLREEKSARSGRFWLPEPDLAIVRGVRGDFRRTPPRLNLFALAIEVADTSYAKDRGVKWRRYAASGIPVYWIVNLSLRRVEVYGRPEGRGRSARYLDSVLYLEGDRVPVAIDGVERGRLAIRDFLP